MLKTLIYKQSVKLKKYNVIYRLGIFLNDSKKIYTRGGNITSVGFGINPSLYFVGEYHNIINLIGSFDFSYENLLMFRLETPGNNSIHIMLFAKLRKDFYKLTETLDKIQNKLIGILNYFHDGQYKLASKIFYKFVMLLMGVEIAGKFIFIIHFNNNYNTKNKYIIFHYDIYNTDFRLKVIYGNHELIEIKTIYKEKSIMHCLISYNQYYNSRKSNKKYNMAFTRNFIYKCPSDKLI